MIRPYVLLVCSQCSLLGMNNESVKWYHRTWLPPEVCYLFRAGPSLEKNVDVMFTITKLMNFYGFAPVSYIFHARRWAWRLGAPDCWSWWCWPIHGSWLKGNGQSWLTPFVFYALLELVHSTRLSNSRWICEQFLNHKLHPVTGQPDQCCSMYITWQVYQGPNSVRVFRWLFWLTEWNPFFLISCTRSHR